MANRETWDFKTMNPGEPVKMKLIFDITARNHGTKEKEDGTTFFWHSYPVSVDGTEYTMFTPFESVHLALQRAGVTKKGMEFTITQQAGKNPGTGKLFSYYVIDHRGTRVSSLDVEKQDNKDGEEPPDEPFNKPSTPEKTTPAPEQDYESEMVNIWNAAYAWVSDEADELDDEKRIQIRMAVIEKTCPIVCNRANLRR